jgi:hypothetical protein
MHCGCNNTAGAYARAVLMPGAHRKAIFFRFPLC